MCTVIPVTTDGKHSEGIAQLSLQTALRYTILYELIVDYISWGKIFSIGRQLNLQV